MQVMIAALAMRGLSNDASFDKVVFSTSEYAFESDNHAYANISKVPEPTTLTLMGLALAAVGFTARRRRHTA